MQLIQPFTAVGMPEKHTATPVNGRLEAMVPDNEPGHQPRRLLGQHAAQRQFPVFAWRPNQSEVLTHCLLSIDGLFIRNELADEALVLVRHAVRDIELLHKSDEIGVEHPRV